MNAVEIEQAVSHLAQQPFDGSSFPYAFLEAFGNKATTLKRLKSGDSNKSDLPATAHGVLQTNNIHIAIAAPGGTVDVLQQLRDSPATRRFKVKYILATDGELLQAEELTTGEPLACTLADLPNHFGFFLSLAGISTVQAIRDSAFDIRATARLNKLYIELLKENPDWGTAARRDDLNHFMARLIFCFFAEDTDIFNGQGLFTQTLSRYSEASGANTHQVMGEIFRAMNVPTRHQGMPDGRYRQAASLRPWADQFPYVNGGLFGGALDVPRFSRIARSYLLQVGTLDWTQINPDIFGSMIQAVADEGERSLLGMHYTSVPNILKVLNPLFLDDLRAKLLEAGDNKTKLLNLRKRMARIRVFDPACGSGNFLVIAYKQMREIEADINQKRGEPGRASDIPTNNFRGIELRSFAAEIARLALIIAEYQCDVRYRGQKEALGAFLPLDSDNWITCGNALKLDWLSICPPTGTGVKLTADDLFETPLDQAEIDFKNEGGETYICGNPPYLGSTWQSVEQKSDLQGIFAHRCKSWKNLDYVAGWFMKAADYGLHTAATTAFVSTNSICQGQQVPILWPLIFETGHQIAFAHTSFKWANLASHNAGVTVAIVGISREPGGLRKLYSLSDDGQTILKEVPHINAYLVAASDVVVEKSNKPMTEVSEMDFGSKPTDGGHLLLTAGEVAQLHLSPEQTRRFIKRIVGSAELIRGVQRYCLWINDEHLTEAKSIKVIADRMDAVRKMRLDSPKPATVELAEESQRFGEIRQRGDEVCVVIPIHTGEIRPYLPVGLCPVGTIVSNAAYTLTDAPLWNLALIASKLHLVWIATVCGKLKTDFRYSNTLGWNTFPLPTLTEQNKTDLTRCAENILLAREAHFPATIADLYEPSAMPQNLRDAHAQNDETLERIYIGRTFKNDTERLEKLFALYTQMMQKPAAKAIKTKGRRLAESGKQG
ncbi:MAG: lactate dehydrogenase [Pseudomonadota bacterium]|nr:lactate dehydrogenase [Pseudomonadota bacterium]